MRVATVACVMPTHDRPVFARRAIELFQRQTFPRRVRRYAGRARTAAERVLVPTSRDPPDQADASGKETFFLAAWHRPSRQDPGNLFKILAAC
jgi:hypothetical protein